MGAARSTASSRRWPSPSERGPRGGDPRARRPRCARWHALQRPARRPARDRARRRARAALGSARARSASTCRAGSSRRSSCAPCRRRSRASSGSSSPRRPAGAGLVAAAARLLGLDEVWALGGPPAIAALAYGTESIPTRRQDRRAGQRLRERGEAAGLARRRDRPARRARPRSSCSPDRAPTPRSPSSSSRPRREHGPGRRVPRRRRGRRPRGGAGRGRGARARAPRAPRRRRGGARLAGSETRALCSSGRGRPWPPATTRPAANHVLPTGGWARAVGGLGLETFLKPITVQRADGRRARCAAAHGRGARRGRGHAGARGGGAAMRALAGGVRAVPLGAVDERDRRGRRASTRSRSSASTGTCRPLPSPTARPGAIAAALAGRQRATRTAGIPELVDGDRRATRASSRRTSCSARAPTT